MTESDRIHERLRLTRPVTRSKAGENDLLNCGSMPTKHTYGGEKEATTHPEKKTGSSTPPRTRNPHLMTTGTLRAQLADSNRESNSEPELKDPAQHAKKKKIRSEAYSREHIPPDFKLLIPKMLVIQLILYSCCPRPPRL